MSRKRIATALLLSVLGVAGCAAFHSEKPIDPNPGLPGRADCVPVLYIQNWDILDPNTMIVYAPDPKDAYLVKLAEPVADLGARDSLGFVSGSHDGRICGASGDLMVRGSLRVPLTAVRALRKAEVKRLKPPVKHAAPAPKAAAPAVAAPASTPAPTGAPAPTNGNP